MVVVVVVHLMVDNGGHDQDKKVLVADPDVLSFNVVDHKMQFAGLGSSLLSKIEI